MRTTNKMLDIKIEQINKETGNPTEYSTDNVGQYHYEKVYGGYSFVQIGNKGGGLSHVIRGIFSKKELYYTLEGFLEGVLAAKRVMPTIFVGC